MARNLFIAFEGIDGSGKDTQAKILKNYLEANWFDSVFTSEPYQEDIVKARIRKIGQNPIEAARAFIEDRSLHISEVISPALASGKYVISSRFRMSTDAYQSALGLSLNEVIALQNGILQADITFFCRVTPETGLKRIAERKKAKEPYEQLEFLRKVALQYEACLQIPEALSLYGRIIVLDAEKSKEEVTIEMLAEFNKAFEELKAK